MGHPTDYFSPSASFYYYYSILSLRHFDARIGSHILVVKALQTMAKVVSSTHFCSCIYI